MSRPHQDGIRSHEGAVLAMAARRSSSDPYAVSFDDKGGLELPDLPARDDLVGMCRWLTSVFNLDRSHPIDGGRLLGVRGAGVGVELYRKDADSLLFEPAKIIYKAQTFTPALGFMRIRTDGVLYGFKNDHCARIAEVVRRLCETDGTITEEEQTIGVVTSHIAQAVCVEGYTTYGNSAQRYEAIMALQREADDRSGRPLGPARYLLDASTGEFVIAVSDLQASARHQLGSLPHGWLKARAELIGWDYLRIQGYGTSSDGRGPHANRQIVRGLLAGDPERPQQRVDVERPKGRRRRGRGR